MVKHGGRLWDKHPAVRTGNDLSIGERAADGLKAAFGTWSLLFAIIAGICLWMTFVYDPGELHLNLGLSFLASVQGVILQIAANRGDRISAEVALHTQQNTDILKDQSAEIKEQGAQILTLTHQQMELLAGIDDLRAEVSLLARTALPASPQSAAGSTTAGGSAVPARRTRTPRTTKEDKP